MLFLVCLSDRVASRNRKQDRQMLVCSSQFAQSVVHGASLQANGDPLGGSPALEATAAIEAAPDGLLGRLIYYKPANAKVNLNAKATLIDYLSWLARR